MWNESGAQCWSSSGAFAEEKRENVAARDSLAIMSPSARLQLPEGVEVRGEMRPPFSEILTLDALEFLATLERAFRSPGNEHCFRPEGTL